ncbi:MAG TPA: hypothetical protein VGI74_25975, partial [Streptosporangiaceae bacterium]
DTSHTEPGDLMRRVAAGLLFNGFDVRPPEHDDECRLTISCPKARCTLSVSDSASIELECTPWASGQQDPKRVADLATALLTGQAQDHPRLGDGYDRHGITFKGIVGLELKARGFDVELEVYEDDHYFDAPSAIVVTVPDHRDDAAVLVADDGSIVWTCDYWAEAATITLEPDFHWWIADPANLASTVVATVTAAMSQAELTDRSA